MALKTIQQNNQDMKSIYQLRTSKLINYTVKGTCLKIEYPTRFVCRFYIVAMTGMVANVYLSHHVNKTMNLRTNS